ncbi:MAG: hypothetical protein O8C67_10815 [Candidatus Methanoperedens sp.]|nr:hypothetical protein [Candidatus Methanoperedens sp.]
MSKRFFFVVCINGEGDTKEEAWLDAVEHFYDRPEDPPKHEDQSLLTKVEMEDPPSEHIEEIECYAATEEEEE